MYPKVKVRGEGDEDDHHHHHFFPIFSAPEEHEDVPASCTAKVPKSYVPNTASSFPDEIPKTAIPKISSQQDTDILASAGPEKCSKKNEEHGKEKLCAYSILRPRAVLSSPDNDLAIGNKNRHKSDRSSVPKNRKAIQNRHSLCKTVPETTESSPNVKNSTEDADATKLRDSKGSVPAGPTQRQRIRTEKPGGTRI